MTSDDIVKILVQLGVFTPILAGAVAVVISAIKKAERKTDDVLKKVNGAHTASQTEIKGLRAEVQGLRADKADQKQVAAVLAAQTAPPVLPPPPTP